MYDKLVAYNGVFMLLYDQRTDMAQINVDKNTVLNLLDDIYHSASALNVKKDQTKKLQSEIVDNYSGYREAIERAYTNMQERKPSAAEGGQK